MELDRLIVLMPDELKTEAKVRAAKEHTTVSDVVRRLLEAWVKGEVNAPEPAPRSEPAAIQAQ